MDRKDKIPRFDKCPKMDASARRQFLAVVSFYYHRYLDTAERLSQFADQDPVGTYRNQVPHYEARAAACKHMLSNMGLRLGKEKGEYDL